MLVGNIVGSGMSKSAASKGTFAAGSSLTCTNEFRRALAPSAALSMAISSSRPTSGVR
jgi:hypothetical protein